MPIRTLIRQCIACSLVLALVRIPYPAFASDYRVGAGDELYVDFPLRGTPADLQPLGGNGLTLIVVGQSVYFRYVATVAPDGYISLPSMPPIRVDGLTVEQIKDQISYQMRSFPLHGNLSVILARPNSSAFSVVGEVVHPGRYIYEHPLTLFEALAVAGGPTDRARLSRVLFLRPGEKAQVLDLSEKRLKESGPPTFMVLPSDKIMVPRKWFTPDNTLVFLLLSIISTSAAVYAASRTR